MTMQARWPDAPWTDEDENEYQAMATRRAASQDDLLAVAGRMYDPERHDPDSILFDDSYTGPSERELMGGCNRCGGLDDCYCG